MAFYSSSWIWCYLMSLSFCFLTYYISSLSFSVENFICRSYDYFIYFTSLSNFFLSSVASYRTVMIFYFSMILSFTFYSGTGIIVLLSFDFILSRFVKPRSSIDPLSAAPPARENFRLVSSLMMEVSFSLL